MLVDQILERAPSDDAMQADADRLSMEPLFVRGVSDDVRVA